MLKQSQTVSADHVFAGGGEMGALMRSFDWSKTPLGPVETWSPSLRAIVRLLLVNSQPMLLWWGPQFIQIYNDPYRPVLGDKHPHAALGRPFSECWSEVFHVVGPLAQTPFEGGPATWMDDILLEVNRYGFVEETHFMIAYSPVPDETAPGGIGGVLANVVEITEKIVGERRVIALRDLAAGSAEPKSAEDACAAAMQSLSVHQRDIPFALVYLLDANGTSVHLAGKTGVEDCDELCPESIDLREAQTTWPLGGCKEQQRTLLVENLRKKFDRIPTGPWSDAPTSAAVVPIKSNLPNQLAGFLIAGISPRLRFDEPYRVFLDLASGQIGIAIANARAYEDERKRNEALAEIDRAKTTFFGNVSHEFRTPLTLMMAPLEDALAQPEELTSATRDRLELAHRNSVRLLKLVNTLLDFSRIEAGRIEASYEPTDLARFTSELASVFRSAIERAGMRLIIDCPSLPQPAYVDREMWEKVVLNLLSNAFKFTFDGEIEVILREADSFAELTVRDTGTGIPDTELSKLFERFHRVKGARGRSFEGSGIGLALVQELVKLHGGTVRVESEIDRGSRFIVSIPLGKAHLPADRIQAARSQTSTSLAAEAYVDEAERWLPLVPVKSERNQHAEADLDPPGAQSDLVLVADDNADMREYLNRLLRSEYRVHAVSNGMQAVEAARRLRPSLILTDIMMPGLDGFGVLQAIRNDQKLRSTPVILLSARAGEESRVEGLHAGADDYLVKPFTARELMARVAAHVKMAALRKQADKSRRLYDTILSNTPDLAYVFDLSHRFIYANKALLSIWGRSWEEAIGKDCLELGYPAWHAELHDREIEQVVATKKPIRGEVPFTGTNGTRVYDYIFVPVLGPNGDVEAVAGTTRDITERNLVEDALRRSEERLRAYVSSTNNVVYRMSPDWSEMRQLEGKDFIADTPKPSRDWLNKYIHPDDQPRVTAAIRRAIETKTPFELEHRVVRIDGTMGWTFSRAIPTLGPDGEIVEWFGTAADMTERRNSEEALRRTEKLAAAGRLAATMAHEINNPLEAVTNLLYLAKSTDDKRLTDQYLTAAEEELERVSQLTKQTLGFYRETKGSSSMRVGSLVEALVPVFASRTRNKGILIDQQIDGDAEIWAAPGEIRQLVANIVSNSIDAVGVGGRICIRVSNSREWSDGLKGVRLTVADNGNGIPDAIRPQLFEPFVTSKKDIGTGLGLWVCKNIVEKYGGSITVKSSTRPGRSWTAFSIFLPLNDSQPLRDEELSRASHS